MEAIKDVIQLLNPWWKSKTISEELAKPYKRHIFKSISELIAYRQIIVLSGLRRVGKTTIVYQVISELLKKYPPEKIFYFNFDKKINDITEILNSYEDLTNVNWKKENVFIFLDEITKLEDWANKIKLIYDAFPCVKFVVSSSSSVKLEEDAIKNLGGRYFLKNIMPLSFKEFLELKGKEKYLENIMVWEKDIRDESKNYMLRNFPEIVEWKDELLIKDYLRTTIIDRILRQDITEKFKNVNTDLLSSLAEIFFSEPGVYLDYDSISKKLRISKKTLFRHMYYLEFSYLIRRIRNFRVSAFASSKKMQRAYPYWWTMACCYTDNNDLIMENVVGSVIDAKYYWRKDGKEIDFLLIDKKKITPIEVKNKKDVAKNDLRNMEYFMEKFNLSEGYVITGEKEDEINIAKGKIKIIPLWKWLLKH